jgi:protoporphyrinogen oxidase
MPIRCLVIGAGFRGLLLSYLLLRGGHSVTLLESSQRPGGVLNGFDWNNYHCDFGCHLFDNTYDRISDLTIEMCGGCDALMDVDLSYGSVTDGFYTKDVAVVDFSPLYKDFGDVWIRELLHANSDKNFVKGHALTLADALLDRFGADLGTRLIPIAKKIYGTDPRNLDYTVISQGILSRIRLADDQITKILKQIPILDEKIAIPQSLRSDGLPKTRPNALSKNFYPKAKGMRGFLESLHAGITNLGGSIYTGQNIVNIQNHNNEITVRTSQGSEFLSDYAISTIAPEKFHNLLEPQVALPESCYVPMVLFFGEYNINDLNKATYLHNFNSDQRVYRYSNQGLYSDQVNKDGRTFICVECPCSEPEFLQASDEVIGKTILSELQALNWIDKHANHSANKVLKIPNAIPIPSHGSADKREKISKALETKFPKFLHFFSDSYSKVEIIQDGLEFAESLNALGGCDSLWSER